MQLCRGGPQYLTYFFADDLILFGEATVEQAVTMMSILESLCTQAGQKDKYLKIPIFCLQKYERRSSRSDPTQLKIQPTDDLGSYLRMPLLHKRVSSHTYEFIVDKIRKKLAAWKARMLSQSSRGLLIQSVLAALPTYAMQTTKLPKTIIDGMEKQMRQFFFGTNRKGNEDCTICRGTLYVNRKGTLDWDLKS